MATYDNWDIQEMPMGSPIFRRKVESFLEANGLRLEAVDAYCVIESPDGEILAGGGIRKNTIKCLAVAESVRSEGLLTPIVSRLLEKGRAYPERRVFTKPANRAIFESLGFHLIASAPDAILMTDGRGLERYCKSLRRQAVPGYTGAIILNANPFTLGHAHLVEQALERVDHLFLIPVREDVSHFPYAERKAMMEAMANPRVTVVEGSDYQISALTFPTYFLKDLSTAAETQMRLDVDLFARYIAPALDLSVRFVGSEPDDALTARYNEILRETHGFDFVEIPRLKDAEGRFVSASRVRKLLDEGRFTAASEMVPATSRPYLLADLAIRALRLELDAPLKPGLVGPDGSGAHDDMDHALMLRSIAALRPWFVKMATAETPEELQVLGVEAEKAMLEATGGVNTHRGAIYSLGLALAAAGRSGNLSETIRSFASAIVAGGSSHGRDAVRRYGVKGAREIALDGYWDLFTNWLPYYRRIKAEPYALQRLLLLQIANLDDTCVLYRKGAETAAAVKAEATAVLTAIDAAPEKAGTLLKALCERFAADHISPGGAADMLALTLFIDSFTS